MIYVTKHREGGISNLWECKEPEVEKAYKGFLQKEADKRAIYINEHHFNIMNFEDHHTHLEFNTYKSFKKDWIKFVKKHHLDWFIENKLHGKKLKFKCIGYIK